MIKAFFRYIDNASILTITAHLSLFNAIIFHITPFVLSIFNKWSIEANQICFEKTIGYGLLGASLLILDAILKQNKILTEPQIEEKMKPIQIEDGIWMQVIASSDAEYVDNVPAYLILSTEDGEYDGYRYMFNLKNMSIDKCIEEFKEQLKRDPNEYRTSSNNNTCSGHSEDRRLSGLCCKDRKNKGQSGETSEVSDKE